MESINMFITQHKNNVIITITKNNNKIIFWTSNGKNKFKNSKKSTLYASKVSIEKAVEKINEIKCKKVNIIIKGDEILKNNITKYLENKITIESIKNINQIPYNGCRPKKKRRI